METVYLSLGSNTGNREALLLRALDRVSAYPGTDVVRVSSIYETAPVDMVKGTRDFLNLCCAVRTDLTPFQLLGSTQGTERELGRDTKRLPPDPPLYGSRTIDIDIIIYGRRIIYTRELIVPHPRFHRRLFVLGPLSEIAPDLVHPLFRLTMDELKYMLKDRHSVGCRKKTDYPRAGKRTI
ncbi:MAG: 2-amino-4-hydroxy-6-hydroxymethyldihydropteridine diphosphokinase [Deltaproteobacteria bacterium]|nr:2-amino-4-hydroxy-6-hydroxymethyldihydropteridine diphosphokinase [Deltaproteobacteria bacterium]MCL5276962.1 2-amino-4-hydroxy-6-hydroxymethyldihydropteridine diphosphokinase [Deltaproteobacteria bacterium]